MNSVPLLTFHGRHGDDIEMSHSDTVAGASYSQGRGKRVVFSSEPLRVGSMFKVKVEDADLGSQVMAAIIFCLNKYTILLNKFSLYYYNYYL